MNENVLLRTIRASGCVEFEFGVERNTDSGFMGCGKGYTCNFLSQFVVYFFISKN